MTSFERSLKIIVSLWLLGTCPALAQSSYAIPASQLTGCPWANLPEGPNKVTVENSKIGVGRNWAAIDGSANSNGFNRALKKCGMHDARVKYAAWRREKMIQDWGLYGGTTGVVTIFGGCTMAAIYWDPMAPVYCLIPAVSVPAGYSIYGIIRGARSDAKQKRLEFEATFQQAIDYKSRRLHEGIKTLKNQIPACTGLTPVDGVQAFKNAKGCKDVRRILDREKHLRKSQHPSSSQLKRLEAVWTAYGNASTCENADQAWTDADLHATIKACTSTQRGWKYYSKELKNLMALSANRATFLRDFAKDRLNSSDRKSAEKTATAKCAEVWSAFGSSSSKPKGEWLNCCKTKAFPTLRAGEELSTLTLQSACN